MFVQAQRWRYRVLSPCSRQPECFRRSARAPLPLAVLLCCDDVAGPRGLFPLILCTTLWVSLSLSFLCWSGDSSTR